MNSTVKTIYNIDLSLANFKRKDYKPLPNTTLNEKFNILMDIDSMNVDNPILKGYCLGNGNIKTIGQDSKTFLHYGNHRSIDGALYSHIPFLIRELDKDLGVTDKMKYRLRKEIRIDNIDYVVYYMKVIEDISITNQILNITSKDGTLPKLSVFNSNDVSILNPTPKEYTDNVTSIKDEYVTVSDQVALILTIDELNEIKNAMKIMGLDSVSTKINELAICSGVDVVNPADATVESAYSQVMLFVDLDYDIELALNEDRGFYREIEIGGMEPISLR